jgi:hypothetical protein
LVVATLRLIIRIAYWPKVGVLLDEPAERYPPALKELLDLAWLVLCQIMSPSFLAPKERKAHQSNSV